MAINSTSLTCLILSCCLHYDVFMCSRHIYTILSSWEEGTRTYLHRIHVIITSLNEKSFNERFSKNLTPSLSEEDLYIYKYQHRSSWDEQLPKKPAFASVFIHRTTENTHTSLYIWKYYNVVFANAWSFLLINILLYYKSAKYLEISHM